MENYNTFLILAGFIILHIGPGIMYYTVLPKLRSIKCREEIEKAVLPLIEELQNKGILLETEFSYETPERPNHRSRTPLAIYKLSVNLSSVEFVCPLDSPTKISIRAAFMYGRLEDKEYASWVGACGDASIERYFSDDIFTSISCYLEKGNRVISRSAI